MCTRHVRTSHLPDLACWPTPLRQLLVGAHFSDGAWRLSEAFVQASQLSRGPKLSPGAGRNQGEVIREETGAGGVRGGGNLGDSA